MQAILKHSKAVLGSLIFIGFSVQIVLGILWMCNAFAGFNEPGEGIVCVGAVLLCGAAVWRAWDGICAMRNGKSDWKKNIFVILSVLSFPFVMQCMMKPDIRLVGAAACLFLLGEMCRWLIRYGVKNNFGKAFLCMSVVAVLFSAGPDIWQNGWTPISMRLTERVVWTTLYDTYAELPQKVRDSVDYYEMVESTYEAGGMRKQFIPSLREDLGKEQATEVLGQFRATAWNHNRYQILKEIFWDAAGYSISPVVVELQLAGRAYDSYTGMNYRELLLPAPKLGKFYLDYSCWWFAVALVAAVVIGLLCLLIEKKRPIVIPWMLGGISAVIMVTYHTLDGAGHMDYKNTLFVLCVWLLWMAGGVQNAKD